MKSLSMLLVVGALGVGLSACGEGHKGAGSLAAVPTSTATPATSSDYRRGDDSDDDDGTAPYDDVNNDSVTRYGHAANRADRAAVIALVKRYYAAAAEEDGAAACSMLVRSFAGAIVEDYGQSPGPAYMRGGKTCHAVIAKLFVHDHKQLVAEARDLQAMGVRVAGDRGLTVLSFGLRAERQMPVQRERGAWKIVELLDRELP